MQKIVKIPTEQEAYNKYAALCARQECCQHDLAEKMLRKGMSEMAVAHVLQQLVEEGFIDEARFSKAFVHEKFEFSRWGKIRIQLELKHKKIPTDYIKAALEEIDEQEYMKHLKSLLEDYKRTAKAKSAYELRYKLMRYAYSRGFEQHLASIVVEDMVSL